jgi:epoxyqueuosine reductase
MMDEVAFNTRFENSPIKRIKRGRLLRNACVAAGNCGDKSAVPALAKLLQDPDPILRGHAAWALHQVGGPQAQAVIAGALINEQDDLALQELIG